jgi:hypothetical protein
MAKRRSLASARPTDFIAEVEFVGILNEGMTGTERTRIVQEILKQWTVRAHRRGRPSSQEQDLKNAA